MTTLADIVNEALSGSAASIKLASARDAAPAASSLDFLDLELKVAAAEGSVPPGLKPKAKKEEDDDDDEKEEKKASHRSVAADADYAAKLAHALTLGANIFAAKMAGDGTAHGAPGPSISRSEHMVPVKSPKAHAVVTGKITGPKVGPGGLPTTKADFTNTDDDRGSAQNHPGKTAGWTANRAASARLMRAKVAQAEMLIGMGQTSAAQTLLDEVAGAQAKLAQDPSSPQPTLPGHNSSFMLSTEPGTSSHIGENASLISMQKSEAKDKHVREASTYITEPAKRDNAVAAHTLRTDGLKLSATHEKSRIRKVHESTGLQASIGTVAGGAGGALLGAHQAANAITKKYPRIAAKLQAKGDVGKRIAGILQNKKPLSEAVEKKVLGATTKIIGRRALGTGAALAGVGALGGAIGSKINRGLYSAADEHRGSKGVEKKSSFDADLGRAYLSKLIKTAEDPDAANADRVRAVAALNTIKDRLGSDPGSLLT